MLSLGSLYIGAVLVRYVQGMRFQFARLCLLGNSKISSKAPVDANLVQKGLTSTKGCQQSCKMRRSSKAA
jgi:hypothetical protein